MRIRTLLAATLAVCVAVAGNEDVFFETEPNDAHPEMLDMGQGARPGEPVTFRIKGRVDTAGDVDRFQLELAAGDVVGVAATDTSGLDPRLRLADGAGDLVIANDDKFFGLQHKTNPPLPRADQGWGGDAILYVVIAAAGNYVLEVAGEDGATGRYRLDVVVARPGLEAHPVGTRQLLFVDFDGAKVHDMEKFGLGGSGTKTLSPLADFLVYWGLTPADEDAVIDAVLETLEERLSTDIRERGLNGDYAQSGIPGAFDLEIRNSRDHADTYGVDPLVTRLVIGGTQAEAGVGLFAFASTNDLGNFTTDDEAVVLLDQLAGLTTGNVDRDLNQFGIAPGRTKAELVGRALGQIGVHEVGHTFGCWHTESTNTVLDPMDRFASAGAGFDPAGVGADGILGTADDFERAFGVDDYEGPPREGLFRGPHDTLNTIAFGLATGRK